MSKRIAIIGGGISGLAAAYFARQKYGDDVNLALYEKDNRLGGTIGTTREDGFIVDWGSNGFLDREQLTLDFVRDIGLNDKLYRSNDKSTKRFIYRNSRLWEINPHPVKFMKSGLLSLKGRLRIALEYFVRSKKDDADESIFDFVARRIGKEAAETLIDPMVSGIYGGDARQLSLAACFPIMQKMEKEYGGLIRAMIKKKKESKAKGGGPAGPSGHLTSFRGGLYTLIEHLGELLKNHIHLSAELIGITKDASGRFVLQFTNRTETADVVILGVPTYHVSKFVKPINFKLSELLSEIPYSNLAVVCQGYKIDKVGRPLDGFGFLVPHSEKRNILGSIWTSIIYPEQAPDGYALLRTMLGGSLSNDIIEKPLGELSEIVFRELSPILKLVAKPSFEKTFIWNRAIPQYTLGHPLRMKQIEKQLEKIGGIYLTGNAYTGIGLNDCIKRSHSIISSLTD